MDSKEQYPKYLDYDHRHNLPPSVLTQEYPLPTLGETEVYYPVNKILQPHFTSEKEQQLFGASQFCSFLSDTIEVEHGLVIPSIATLRRIPFKIPDKPKQDLFKTATDEGFHAEQSLAYLTELENHFGIHNFSESLSPLFIRRLEQQRSVLTNPTHKQLITILNGVITETRISHELGMFAKNEELSESIRRICLTHAQDEVIHSSQFQALGHWLWDVFNEETKELASGFLINSTIARSLPDIDNMIISFSNATGRTIEDSNKIVLGEYSEDLLIDLMVHDIEPTLKFLHKLGVDNFISINTAIENERAKLNKELSNRRKL